MAETLDSLFSPSSPTRLPPPRSPTPQSPSPSSPRRDRASNPLFLSPGSSHHPTPQKRTRVRSPSASRSEQRSVVAREREPSLPPLLPLDDEFVDPFAGLEDVNGDAEEDDGKAKKRRVIAKIDGDRLMSDRGIPALMRAAKRFKPKGKGHEVADLGALLNMYQMWAHGMFPKGDFAGTISRVEAVCRTRRMENAMKGYRDAFYPPPPSPTPPPRSASELRLTPPSDVDEPDFMRPRSKTPLFDLPEDGDRQAAEPETNDDGDEGEMDMDEMMAMEEMEREERERGQGGQQPRSAEPASVDHEDEWEGLYD
ncbi:replication fork protection component Swi3-domain-containing protein [Naematelia encephala]|uniref:Chromosome segregation in meiosis protein n=1 Tax=Naematelia encephala TaxID=71784 RepID=A0A1Y2B8A4_9TREE|nr:replication fork protection component Swi3-domain-containing protein [Naematelia encephala]